MKWGECGLWRQVDVLLPLHYLCLVLKPQITVGSDGVYSQAQSVVALLNFVQHRAKLICLVAVHVLLLWLGVTCCMDTEAPD